MRNWPAVFATELGNGLRQLRRRPAISALIVLILALGLGSALFVLTAVDAMVLRPMPFPEPERLVQIGRVDEFGDEGLGAINSQDFLDLRAGLSQFEAVEGFYQATMNLAEGARVERHEGVFVSGGLFALLGQQAALGRTVAPADDTPAAGVRVVLSDRVWRERFGADAGVIGRAVRLNAQPAEVIGVMPPGFAFPFTGEMWAAGRHAPGEASAQQREFEVLARLGAGASMDSAAAELQTLWPRLQAARPELRRDVRLALLPAAWRFVDGGARNVVSLMLLAAISVLLVACANVANLQLAQFAERSRELALRAAIGAGRGRLLGSLLAETLVLNLVAVALAAAFTHWAGTATLRYFVEAGDGPAYWISFALTPRVALCGIAVAFASTLFAGLWPGWRASGLALNRVLASHGRSGLTALPLVRTLIVAQIAISFVLLLGAGLVWRLLDGRNHFDLGIGVPTQQLLTARVAVFPEKFPDAAARVAFFERVGERLRAEPGVVAATVAEATPGFMAGGAQVRIEGTDPQLPRATALRSSIDDQFGPTYGVVALSGRLPDARDRADTQPVVVVDQRFAARHWPQQDPLGRRLRLADDGPWIEVVGVVRALTLEDVDDPLLPSLLLPMRQQPVQFATIAVRTAGDPAAFAPRLAEIVREVDADTPVYWVRTLADALARDRAGDRFLSGLFAIFGAVGLTLAGAGLFGVLAQVVQARTREIGVRRVVGASTRAIVALVTRDSTRLLLAGLVFGAALGLPWAWLLARAAPDLNPFDLTIFAAVAVLVLFACLLAVLFPARRALAIAPAEALRAD
ncbi:MAG: ABC transporter permease [Xanthomonadales bacterium]|nr:ABC transporter permease [Xanthomonadales bacterium]